MFQKLWINRIGALIVLLCTYLLVFGFIRSSSVPSEIIPVGSEVDTPLPIIILDAGHGGIDSGCLSVNGVEEKDINLSILLKLKGMLEASGFKVEATRDTDRSIHDAGVSGLGNQKKSDMENRLKLINSEQNAVFISIHQNQFTDPKYYGAQMFYPEESSESERLAGILQGNFVSYLQPENKRETKPVGSEIYLLHFAECPAVMAECGFLSNPEEAALLETEDYQSKVAFTIYKSLCDYIFDTEGI